MGNRNIYSYTFLCPSFVFSRLTSSPPRPALFPFFFLFVCSVLKYFVRICHTFSLRYPTCFLFSCPVCRSYVPISLTLPFSAMNFYSISLPYSACWLTPFLPTLSFSNFDLLLAMCCYPSEDLYLILAANDLFFSFYVDFVIYVVKFQWNCKKVKIYLLESPLPVRED